MSRILIAGAGAVGQWLGAKLYQSGHDVTLLCRPEHATAIRRGLRITGHTEFRSIIPTITSALDATGFFEGIFITCKSYDTNQVLDGVQSLLTETGVIVNFQNGLGNSEKSMHHALPSQIAVGVTSHGFMFEEPGHLAHTGLGEVRIGPHQPREPQGAKKCLGWLQNAGLDPVWHPTMTGQVWWKAIINCAINPLAAIHGLRNGQILDDEEVWEESQRLANEATSVARKICVTLPNEDPIEAVRKVLESTRDNECSMLKDIQAGRRTEIEELSGAIIRLAQTAQVPVPTTIEVYDEIKRMERHSKVAS